VEHWKLIFSLLLVCLPLCAQLSQSASADDESTHQALRAMRDATVSALNRGDMEAVMPHLHNNIVFTAMNGELCRGKDALRAYFNKMMKDPGHIVESLQITPTVDHLTDIYGNTGVAYGSSVDHYKLTNGNEFDVNSRWTATLVKEDGNWEVASFQSAANIFDNPLINKATKALYWGVGAAGAFGFLLGVLIGKRRGKRTA
jgi:ketosteroid isomerase-like protein